MSVVKYTEYIDSHNKSKKMIGSNGDDNPTNNIIIPLHFARQIPVAQLQLASLEFPLAQYTVEEDGNRLYFDEGLDILVDDTSLLGLSQFVISENGTQIIGQLPVSLNPIVDVDNTAINNPIFTTLYPHALALRTSYNWGEDMQLISTLLTGEDTHLNSDNAKLVILDDYTFQLVGVAAVAYTSISGIYGYVNAPTIPSPEILAQLVTDALQLEAPNHWSVTFNVETGKFMLKWLGSGCAADNITPAILVLDCTNNNLGTLMGFGNVSIEIPLPEPEMGRNKSFDANTSLSILRQQQDVGLEPITDLYALEALYCYLCKSSIEIAPGNYDASGLGVNLSLQLNRFYFEPGCNAALPPTSYTFVFSTACGECKTIALPVGKYTPETLASYLEIQMNLAHPNNYIVTFDLATGTFTFSGTNPFGLEFNQVTGNIYDRLGFLPVCYRNTNTYTSPRPFAVATKGCCNIPSRYTSYLYTPLILSNERKYNIQVCKPRCWNEVVAVNNGDGTATLATSTDGVGVAHGYQPNDVIHVTNFAGTVYQFRVLSNAEYNLLTIDLGSVPFTEISGGNSPFCTCLEGLIVGNLYFSECNQMIEQLPSRLLGFEQEDIMWEVGFNGYTSTVLFNLDWPSYVLLALDEPASGSTNNWAAWKNNIRSKILTKILLYPQIRIEKHIPSEMTFGGDGVKGLNHLKFVFLNPDLTLYKLHGKNWSASITFMVADKYVTMQSH